MAAISIQVTWMESTVDRKVALSARYRELDPLTMTTRMSLRSKLLNRTKTASFRQAA